MDWIVCLCVHQSLERRSNGRTWPFIHFICKISCHTTRKIGAYRYLVFRKSYTLCPSHPRFNSLSLQITLGYTRVHRSLGNATFLMIHNTLYLISNVIIKIKKNKMANWILGHPINHVTTIYIDLDAS